MQDTPQDWPRLSCSLFYENAAAAIDWLGRAFGFEVRLKIEGEGGRIEHSELTYGGALIMVGEAGQGPRPEHALMVSPTSLGGKNTQVLCVVVDDADAHCARARAVGARIFREPAEDDHGEEYALDRTYGAVDPGGHMWFFLQRIRDPKR
jgi:uncharacterized glyoxalase superfamily protein PhnB